MFRLELKSLREQEGLSQSAFAKKIGVAQSTVGGWESGVREPSFDMVKRIADFFGVTVDDLLGRNVPHKEGKGVKIPVLGYVKAGIPVEAVEDILDYEEITPELAASGDFFALRINGNSMAPRFLEGDVVIVRKQPDVDSGAIAIVIVNGDDATIKKVVKHPGGISLVPLNPEYDPIFFTNDEIFRLPVTILGKVVELRGKF